MIEEQGTVRSVQGDIALVATQRKSACGFCGANSACGTGIVSRLFEGRSHLVSAVNRANARAGDQVILGVQESALVSGSTRVYLLPLLGLFAGGLAGSWVESFPSLAAGELPTIGGAAAGFALAVWWLRQQLKMAKNTDNYQPVVLRTAQRGLNVVERNGE